MSPLHGKEERQDSIGPLVLAMVLTVPLDGQFKPGADPWVRLCMWIACRRTGDHAGWRMSLRFKVKVVPARSARFRHPPCSL